MDVTRPAPADLSDQLTAVRRSWWLVVALICLGLLVSAGVTARLPRSYQSTASVLVLPTDTQDANAVGGRTKGAINLDTEAQLVQSTAVAERARTLLRSRTAPTDLSSQVSVAVPPNSTVLQITFTAGDAHDAQAGAHAFATAYLANRQSNAQSATDRSVKALRAQIAQITKQLQDMSSKITTLPTGSADRAFLLTQRRNLSNQLNTLTTRLNDESTDPINAGRIISDAALPTSPASPVVPINLAAGALVGLILGLVAALLRGRLDRRIRRADDLRRGTGVPVLAELGAHPDRLLASNTDDGRLFSRLRNELASGPSAERAMIVVIGVSAGPVATTLATNLAAAFGRAGTNTVLVAADGTALSPTTAAELLDVPATPGWSDVLTGGTGLDEALQPAPREPNLRVLTAGGAASASGLCQSETARTTLAKLRNRAEQVIVAAPDADGGADAQTLARLADAAVLAVETRTARRDKVIDAAEQVRRVGTPLLGAVLVRQAPPAHGGTATTSAEGRTDGPARHAAPGRPAGPVDADTEPPTLVLPRIGQGRAASEAPDSEDVDPMDADPMDADSMDADLADADGTGPTQTEPASNAGARS